MEPQTVKVRRALQEYWVSGASGDLVLFTEAAEAEADTTEAEVVALMQIHAVSMPEEVAVVPHTRTQS